MIEPVLIERLFECMNDAIRRGDWVVDGACDPDSVLRQAALFITHHRGHAMENQHTNIHGYRELTTEEIGAINAIKGLGYALGALVTHLKATPSLDQRWVNIGITDLQTGLMALTRAVSQPTTF